MKGKENTLGNTLTTMTNMASLHAKFHDFGKAEELYQRALEGYEAQLGKDNNRTMDCANNFKIVLKRSRNVDRLAELKKAYPNLI